MFGWGLTVVPLARLGDCWSVASGIIYPSLEAFEALSGCYSIAPRRIGGERLGTVTGG
jgi:hypothetical protein